MCIPIFATRNYFVIEIFVAHIKANDNASSEFSKYQIPLWKKNLSEEPVNWQESFTSRALKSGGPSTLYQDSLYRLPLFQYFMQVMHIDVSEDLI